MISNVYMKHAKVSLERPKKVDRARVAAVIIFMAVMLGICILPQILYGMEAMRRNQKPICTTRRGKA